MTRDRLWLWCKTIAGAAVVYATVPFLAVAWIAGKLLAFPGGVRRRLLWAVVAVPLGFFGWWLFGSHSTATDPLTIQVRPGMSFAALTDSLTHYGVIRYPHLFRVAARIGRFDRRLHVGLYEFPAGASPYDILSRLARHEQINVQFTVVEGAVMRDFLPQMARELSLAPDSLNAAVSDPKRRERLRIPTDRLEGYLFPETYTVPWGADAGTVVDAMIAQFEAVWSRVSRDYNGSLTRHEAVTLASLVEAEAKDGRERGKIASVFHNRLRRKMRMQCDPTVIYAMGGLDRPLLRKDWQYESPYNTYLVAGLPPGPICSPGEAALRAALYPDSTDLLYFVAKGDGTHVFSRTLVEHERAIAEIKRDSSARR
jgi:UPF0755 protein